jgi:hypothetical protein
MPGRWLRAAGRPVEQFDGVHDRRRASHRQLNDATDIAGGDQVATGLGDVGELAVAQPRGKVGLQQVVGPGGAAAQMTFRNFDGGKPGAGE